MELDGDRDGFAGAELGQRLLGWRVGRLQCLRHRHLFRGCELSVARSARGP
ncbi:MAG: hypothetical protein MZV70_62720 [Desulfobacterales bacterium]|nr:hypothetical protein [Desulfobacterales bacterium]